MNKPNKLFYIIGFILLVLLFLMSTTDLFFQERDVPVYAISVIVDDTTDDFWLNYKKGMDQAAGEFNVDISFVTLYDNRNEQNFQQTELIRREIEDGAQALVIAAADSQKLAESLNEMVLDVPVIAIQTSLPYQELDSSVLPDDSEMGQMLADEISECQSRDEHVYILALQLTQDGLKERCHQLERALTEAGFQVSLLTGEEPGIIETLVQQVTERQEKCVMVGLDAGSLLDTASCVEAYYGNYLVSVYGFGYNAQILSMVESEKINGTVISDDYVMGYQSIEKAVACLNMPGVPASGRLNTYLVTKDLMYEDELSRILFPIS